MVNIDEIQKQINGMRATAKQLEASADALEAMIQPWKTGSEFMQAWMDIWSPKNLDKSRS